MNKRLIIVVAALLLSGCMVGSSVMIRDATRVDSFTQLEGASLVLNQDLNLPAERARIFVQNGELSQGFDSYKPHCGFEIDSVLHDGATIKADTFTITGVQLDIRRVVSVESIRLASLSLAGGLGGGGSQSYYKGYHLWLNSVDQPQVRRVSCFGVYAQPYELFPPTLEEIRQALGAIAEIRQ